MNQLKSVLGWVWRNIGVICAALVLAYCVIHAFDPPRLNWGDSDSDYNVLTAGRNFQKYGFLKLQLTPYLLDPAVMSAADRSKIYTHYPQLPDLMNGVLRVVFRLSALPQFRLVALGFSFVALIFVYALIRKYWSQQTAQVALALWVINPLWIQHADYLHHGPYAAFFGFGSVYFLSRYLETPAKRALFLASGVFLFFAFLASYDFWFFAPLLLLGVTLHHFRALRAPAIRTLAGLAAFAAAAIVFKFATNAWALGGIGPFLGDLRFQALERSTNPARHIDIAHGLLTTLYGRVERCFSLLLIPVALFWTLAPLLRARWGGRVSALRARQPNPWWVLLAALPFLTLFAELWVSQYYPTLLVVPFYAIACAAAIVLVLDLRQRWSPWLASAMLVALFANSIAEDVSLKRAFFEDSEIASLKQELDALSQPGQFILVNHLFDSFYAYYFSHQTVDMILNEPGHMRSALAYYTDPKRGRVAPPSGAIFVQHKRLTEELYDKHLYHPLAHNGLWDAWANPEKYHAAIDTLLTEHDAFLMAAVAEVGEKVYETNAYAIWRIRVRPAATPVPAHQN